MAGAIRRPVTLRPPDWAIDPDALAAAITRRRRACCCSTRRTTRPARCSRARSCELIADACLEHDLIAITDEVYEHLVYDGEHVPLATLPGMAERTLTISSLGKTFSVTGWKTGWAVGPRGARRRGAHGQAVPDVRRRDPVPARGRGRARARRRGLRGARARAARQARPPVRRASRRPGWRCCDPPARTSPTSTASATASRSAASSSSAPASWRSRRASSTTTRRRGARSCASRSASASRVIDEAAAAARLGRLSRRRRGTPAPARSCRRAAARARTPPARARSASRRSPTPPSSPRQRLVQAPLAEAVVLPHRVDHAVRVEHEQVARLEHDRRRRPALAVERARDRARRRRPAAPSRPRTSSGGGWPALAIVTTAVPSLALAQLGADDRAQRQPVLAAQRVVEARDGGADVARQLGRGAQR